MKKYCGMLMASLALASCSSLEPSYRTETDITGTKVVIGRITRPVIENDSAFLWFARGYAKYTPAAQHLGELRLRAPELRFELFIGTWCGDSKSEVPKIFKVFDALNIPADRIEMYGVDRKKDSGNGEVALHAVTRIPTLIVYAGDKEIGRIVEYPRLGIEADMSQMLKNAPR